MINNSFKRVLFLFVFSSLIAVIAFLLIESMSVQIFTFLFIMGSTSLFIGISNVLFFFIKKSRKNQMQMTLLILIQKISIYMQ